MVEQIIHIYWEGPFSLSNLNKLNDDTTDYGIYQIYGPHPSYCRNVLLYIGKANQQTFKTRIKQHDWETWQYDEGRITIYVGRLYGLETPTMSIWEKQINLAERLLISAHKPAFNSSGIGELSRKTDNLLRDVHILNWRNYADLLPECTGGRWTDKFEGEFNKYKLK